MQEIDHSKPETNKEKIRHRQKKPIYKKTWVYLLLILAVVVFVFGIPITINEAYKTGTGYITLWDAADVLSFYAVILSGLITVGALIVTITYSKKETDRQLKFYMGQSKAPFFIIDKIIQPGSKQRFFRNNYRQWVKEYGITEQVKLENTETGKIEIWVKNIGDGLALEPSYQVDMFASTIIPENVIEKDKNIVIIYDLQKNLNDKFVYPEFMCGFSDRNSGEAIFYSYIELCYQNMLGIDLYQKIVMELRFDYCKRTILLTINELSPQTGLN